jgi:superfamily II RNA helicase
MRFEYDPFQKKSIEAIEKGNSVFVSAPTGSGKTAIAEYTIEMCLKSNKRVIYTAPIKAISNQKFRDFSTQYPGKVGILTGDVSLNTSAQVLIMTTEIYRNQLFENPKQHEHCAWVIFDEVHYLDDYERGTVWEEAIMFSKPETRFLALSATAPNIQQLADWIKSLHQHTITVIQESRRPVQLVHQFQCQNEIFKDVHSLKKTGFMGRLIWQRQRYPFRKQRQWRGGQGHKDLRAKTNSLHELFSYLIKKERLPCLYFTFSRKRVEELAHDHTYFRLLNADETKENVGRFDALCERYDLIHEKSAIDMRRLVTRGVAYHHAGMLPTLKEVVEQLFTSKLIRLIFTTETFALGINMPARTVVFDELRKFYGFGFDNLTTRDYYQMAGRAGRRNMDAVGYVYSRINPHQISIPAVTKIIHGPMEPIHSQFNASYATLLNLYKRLGHRLLEIYPKSLHHFQSNPKRQRKGIRLIENKLELLRTLGYIKKGGLTPKGEFASWLYGYELMISELLEQDVLDHLSATECCVMLLALAYEPRRNEHSKPLGPHLRHLERSTRRVIKKIHDAETACNVKQFTRPAHFNLSKAIEAWTQGASFHDIFKFTDVDEGILIRYFRMVIQLLRQLQHAPGAPERLRGQCRKAIGLVNRDIIDAEKYLGQLSNLKP